MILGARLSEETVTIKQAAEAMLARPIQRLISVGSGANSHVFRAYVGVDRYAVKIYPTRRSDLRPRVVNEWHTLNFLAEHGVSSVPHAIAHDVDRSILIMEWIEGAPIGRLQDSDIDACLGFLGQIFSLSLQAQGEKFSLASEACLSGREIYRQITMRRSQFIAHPELKLFLGEVFDPLLAIAYANAADSQINQLLTPSLRRLIPADFGLHNAIREHDGRLRFIDFDYFGWDDPVKVAADFVLHPAMTLTTAQQERFIAGIVDLLPDDREFLDRLHRYKPLYALRWALILLNPFRRDRQSGSDSDPALYNQQLAKASALCASMQDGSYLPRWA